MKKAVVIKFRFLQAYLSEHYGYISAEANRMYPELNERCAQSEGPARRVPFSVMSWPMRRRQSVVWCLYWNL